MTLAMDSVIPAFEMSALRLEMDRAPVFVEEKADYISAA